MVDVDEVIGRLEHARGQIGHVGADGAADYESVRGRTARTPFLHVIPTHDKPLPQRDMGVMPMASLSSHFDVLISVRNVTDSTGRKSHAELRDIRLAIMKVLIGWTPTYMSSPLLLNGGRLLFMGNNLLQWADSYQTSYVNTLEFA